MPWPYMERWRDWQAIESAPFGEDVRLVVKAKPTGDPYELPFHCKQIEDGWMNSRTGTRLTVIPVYWQKIE